MAWDGHLARRGAAMLRAAAAAAVFIALLAAPARAGDPDLPTEPVVKELAPGVFQYINANGLWNSGFVIGDRAVAVIDAMLTPADARKVKAEIEKRTDKPIRYLVITHQHSDHYFGAQIFTPPAELIAHAAVRDHYANNLEKELAFRKRISPDADLSEVEVVLPTISVAAEGKVMTLALGGKDVELHHFGPGQTPGALFAYVPGDRVLFTGDVFNRKSINFMARATSLDGWFRVLDRLQEMDATIYAGGHGLPASKDDFDAYRRMLTDFIEGVKDARERGLSAEQAAAEMTLPQYENWRNYERFRERNIVGLYKRFAKEAGGK